MGALVGGPGADGTYKDDQADYNCNEVALDYNAGLVGAAAGLYLVHKNDDSVYLSFAKKSTDNFSNELASEKELSDLGVTKYYGSSESKPLESISLKDNISLVVGDTDDLTVTLKPSNAAYKDITWSVNEEGKKVVKVTGSDKKATLEALAVGEATITVKVTTDENEEGFTAACKVTVTNPVKDFQLEKEEITLEKGEKEKLEYTLTPEKPSEKYTIEWKSKDSTVASVDTDGTVTARNKGTTVITATLKSDTKTITRECTVNVIVSLTDIKLSKTELTLDYIEKEDTSVELTVSPIPEDADLGEEIKWSSDKPSVAEVVGNGKTAKVIPKGKGTATITVEAKGKKATCQVTVRIPVTKITLPATWELEMQTTDGKKDTVDLSEHLKFFPEYAEDDLKKVTWESSDSDIINVTSDGEVSITNGKENQKAIITATLVDSNPAILAKCEVSIVGVKVTGITINEKELSLKVKEEGTLTATVEPENATNANNVKWTSDDESIATVSYGSGNTKECVITGVGEGTTTITASAGSFSETCIVTVTKKEQEKPIVELEKVNRTYNSVTVKGTITSDSTNTTGKLEFARVDNDDEVGEAIDDTTAIFEELQEFEKYTFKARLAGDDEYEASDWADARLDIYTLVENPYFVDVSELANTGEERVREYVEAHRTNDGDKDPTISFDPTKGELTLSETAPAEYTITGENEDITIVTESGDYNITLQDTTIKKVDVTESNKVRIKIVGSVKIKEGIVSGGKTDIEIVGEDRQGTLETPSVRTEGDVTITDVTVEADAFESKPSGPAISGENVTIEDSKVNATGGDGSPAIEADKGVKITDSDVTAKGGNNAPAIEAGEDVTITDSNVSAEAGAGAPAIKGKKAELLTEKSSDSNIDLKADEGQKGVEADEIVVDSPNVSFNGNSNADLDDIYSVTPKDKSGKDITSGGNGNGGNGNGGNGNGGNGNGDNGNGNKDTNPIGDTKTQATSLTLTGSVAGAKNIPVGKTIKLAPKKKITLNVSFAPEDAEKESLTFTSSKPAIAKVDSKGKVTAGKKAGKATITIQSANGLKKTVTVQVMKKAVSKVKIKASKTTIKVKKTVKLKATLTPNKKNASNNVFWKSSKPKVATVSSKGVVKGLKKGKTKITAVATDGSGKKATITIQVK